MARSKKTTNPVRDPQDRPLTIAQQAEAWGVSESTIRRRIAAGELRAVKSGRIVRIWSSDMEALFGYVGEVA